MMRRFLSLIVVFGLILPVYADSTEQLFQKGNDYYSEGKFPEAINAYEGALATGYESSEIYFNLGNAYFRDGQLGRSLLNYVRARRLDPRDDDINTNIEFARQFAVDRMEVTEGTIILDYFNTFFNYFSLTEIAWLAAIVYMILVALVVLGLLYGRIRISRGMVITVLTVFVILSIFTAVKYDRDILTRTGVIVATSVDVRNGPGDDYENQFTAHAGLMFNIEREDSGWYLVDFENRLKGWLPVGAVEEI